LQGGRFTRSPIRQRVRYVPGMRVLRMRTSNCFRGCTSTGNNLGLYCWLSLQSGGNPHPSKALQDRPEPRADPSAPLLEVPAPQEKFTAGCAWYDPCKRKPVFFQCARSHVVRERSILHATPATTQFEESCQWHSDIWGRVFSVMKCNVHNRFSIQLKTQPA
jgi:hypothetical protein